MTRNPTPELLLHRAEHRRRVFISYSHHDESQALRLIAELQAAGHECWIDTSDIKGGDEWVKAIAEGINNSYVLVPIITENARRSEWMQIEILWAKRKGLRIIPWALEDLMSAEEFIALVTCQWLMVCDLGYAAPLEMGSTSLKGGAQHDNPEYKLHPPKAPLVLQDHNNAVHFRKIWVRPL